MATRLADRSPREARRSIYSGLPRLSLPRERGRVIARHFRRTVLRVITLVASDLATLRLLEWIRPFLPWGNGTRLVDTSVAVLLGLALVGAYGRGEVWKNVSRIIVGVGLGTLVAGWATVNEDPHALLFVMFLWAGVSAGLCAERWILAVIVDVARRRLLSPERVLLVGGQEDALDEIHAPIILRQGVEVVGRVLLARPDSQIWDALYDTKADTVVIAGELPSSTFGSVVRAATLSGCYVLSVSRYDRLGGLRPKVVWWGGTPFNELSLPELTAPQLALKRAVDIVGAMAGLVLLSPLLALIALLVKATSPGPVLFKQIRIGFGGSLFWVYKFRTMCSGADEMKQSLAHLNASGDHRLFKIRDDPRVTPIGKALRRWSLDELPQLLNVLKGEMSLVGPRPFFEDDLEDYREEHFSRLAAKPGMTGLWQVRGRSSILDFDEVVGLDLEYVYQWSLLRDVRILLETIPAVLRRAGAI